MNNNSGQRRVIFINGRFATQRMTGVQRTGINLLAAIDELLSSRHGDERWVLLCPAGADLPPMRFVEVVVSRVHLPPHFWQQIVLPWRARGELLLSLAGSAPWLMRRQICTIHDAAVFDRPDAYTFAFRTWYRRLFGHLSRRARAVLTVSRYSAARLAHHLPSVRGRLTVIPNGADHLGAIIPAHDALQRWGLKKDQYLLVVGCQNRLKNLGRLFGAALLVKPTPGLVLVVVGGSHPRVFASDAIPAGSSMPIIPTGTIDDATLKTLYENALALIFPSSYEGFGLPPLEAMSCGCPVAATSAGAVPEVCGDAVLYFDPFDEQAIAAAMQRMIDDAPLRESLRVAGLERARAMSWRSSAELLLEQLAQQGFISSAR